MMSEKTFEGLTIPPRIDGEKGPAFVCENAAGEMCKGGTSCTLCLYAFMNQKKYARWIQSLIDEAFDAGRDVGHEVGHKEGHDSGYHEGYEQAKADFNVNDWR